MQQNFMPFDEFQYSSGAPCVFCGKTSQTSTDVNLSGLSRFFGQTTTIKNVPCCKPCEKRHYTTEVMLAIAGFGLTGAITAYVFHLIEREFIWGVFLCAIPILTLFLGWILWFIFSAIYHSTLRSKVDTWQKKYAVPRNYF
jgi:hypothetical protein